MSEWRDAAAYSRYMGEGEDDDPPPPDPDEDDDEADVPEDDEGRR